MTVFAPPPQGADLKALHSYLYRMAEQLNVALSSLDSGNFVQGTREVLEKAKNDSLSAQAENLRALITQTATSVRQQMASLERTLHGSYVAVSDWGTYSKNLTATILANAEGLLQEYGYAAEIESLQDGATSFDQYLIQTGQYIKTGLLYYDEGIPRYGVAVGERLTTQEVDGITVLSRQELCATFTSDRLSFWMGGIEVAYVSNNQLYITSAHISSTLTLGGWEMANNNGNLLIRWVG